MQIAFPFFIGVRYTGTRRRNQLVSFLSAISIAGLVVGVALLVAVLSVMNGFDSELRQRILGLIPQAAIYHRDGIEDWRSVQSQLKKNIDVVHAAPFVQLTGLVRYRNRTTSIALYGIDPESELKVSNVQEYIPRDDLLALAHGDAKILLGKGIVDQLQTAVGEKVMLVIPNKEKMSRAPKIAYFRVAGIIHSQTEVDTSLAITALVPAIQLSGIENKVTGMRLKLRDLFDAPAVVYQNLLSLGSGYYGTNWTRTHGNLYHAIQMSKNLVGLLISLIIAIAAFNVVSTLVMVVVDKQGDIAILRTLGLSTQKIMMIFIVQGSVIGLVGTVLGVVLGCLLALGAQDFVAWLEQLIGFQFLKSDVYPLTYIPTEIRFQDVSRISLTALLLSFLATLYPAWRASRVEPAEALRYE